MRSVGDLRSGILKLRQRLEYAFNADDTAILIDPALEDLYNQRHPDWLVNRCPNDDKLYLNSRIVVSDEAIAEIKSIPPEHSLISCGQYIAIRSNREFSFGLLNIDGIQTSECQIPLYGSIADLIHDNARMINWDFEHIFYEEDNFFETETGVSVLDPYKVWIAEGVRIAPNVVLDASAGPIVVDSGATIMANAVIQGPAYIGKKTVIKIGAKIYGGTSIGPVCKIGGEIEASIIQAYSNKQHDGFLGHAYIGEWVNMGADTNNSDLKNTYKNVKIYDYAKATMIDSGSQFMGCVLGDHVKTGINVSLNTGLTVGTGSNIFGSKLFSGYVHDFSWGEADGLTRYRFSDFCDTATMVKHRRALKLISAEIELLRNIAGV